MTEARTSSIDPDFFQFVVATLSALADLATVFQVAREAPSKLLAFDPNTPEGDQVRNLRKEYQNLFAVMDRAIGLFAQYEDAMRNVDATHRVGFGSFLTNLTQYEFREYRDLRQALQQAALNIGIWTATIIELMPKHAGTFSKAAVLNHTEINDILLGDLSYSELAIRYRDLKEKVETFFEGLFKRSNA